MDLNKLISQMTVEEKLGQMFQLVSFEYLSDKKRRKPARKAVWWLRMTRLQP